MSSYKLTCPRCQAIFQTPQALAAGQRIQCGRCGIEFAVGPSQPVGAAPPYPRVEAFSASPGPGFATQGTPLRPATNWKAIVLILLGSLVVLGGGAALVIFCFTSTEPESPDRTVEKDQKKKKPNPDKATKDKEKKKGSDKDEPKPTGPVLSPSQQLAVNEAVKRGLEYLMFQQNPDGTWTASNDNMGNFPAGLTTLVGLTLLECDVPKSDPAIQKVAAYLRQRDRSNNKIFYTYEIALALLFLDRLNDAQDKALIQKLGLRLVIGQTPSGGWAYACPPIADADIPILLSLLEKNRDKLSLAEADSKLVLQAVDASKVPLENGKVIPAALKNLAVWRSAIVVESGDPTDNSNTQFAILALWVAKSRGLPVERTLALVADRFHKTQNPDGSWGYHIVGQKKAGLPTMTCAGLLGLAVGQGLVNEHRSKAQGTRKPAHEDPAIQRGLTVVAKQIADPHSPWRNASGAPPHNLYLLWSIERIGVIFNLSKIGGKDWYGGGGEILIANQVKDKGYWENGGYWAQNPKSNTCFGLLFLKRANLAKDLTAKLALED